MNSIIVIYGIILSAVAVNATRDNNYFDKPQAGILSPPFYFDYKRGDYLDATVKLINLSPAVVYKIWLKEDSQRTEKVMISKSAGRKSYWIYQQLLRKDTKIFISLSIYTSWCMSIVIFGSRAVDSNRTADPGFNYNGQCLRFSSPCTLEVDLKDKCIDKSQAVLLRPQFRFAYNKGDYLSAVVNFINLSPALRYEVQFQEDFNLVSSGTLDNRLAATHFPVQQPLMKKTGRVLVAVWTNKSWCMDINLFNGRIVDSNGTAGPGFNYTDVCLRSPLPCYMEVDLRNVCSGDNIKMETLPREHLETTTVSSTARVTSPPVVSDNITYMSNVSTSPHEHMEMTSGSSAASVSNVSTSNVTVIIVSSLSGITFILLVIIASWKRCWMQRNPQGTPTLQTNQNFEPFYPNMLFRRECEREIAEIDRHVYEEVGPPIYEEVDPPVTAAG